MYPQNCKEPGRWAKNDFMFKTNYSNLTHTFPENREKEHFRAVYTAIQHCITGPCLSNKALR